MRTRSPFAREGDPDSAIEKQVAMQKLGRGFPRVESELKSTGLAWLQFKGAIDKVDVFKTQRSTRINDSRISESEILKK